MPKISPFEKYTRRYETWFTKNRWVYEAELRAVKVSLPKSGRGVEIGVGTGRFAAPLKIKLGIEPSSRMRDIAQKRGIQVLDAVAEKLPFDDHEFDFALMVTTICFVDDIYKAFQEAKRILSKGGFLVVGELDRNSHLGQRYAKLQNENVFYKEATFYSVDEIVKVMKQSGFGGFVYQQTIFHSLAEVTDNEPVKPGYGEGSFVVIRGEKG